MGEVCPIGKKNPGKPSEQQYYQGCASISYEIKGAQTYIGQYPDSGFSKSTLLLNIPSKVVTKYMAQCKGSCHQPPSTLI